MTQKRMKQLGILFLLALLCVSGCSGNKQEKGSMVTEKATTRIQKERNKGYPLYAIKKDETTKGYLLGTISTGTKEMYPFPKEILENIKKSDCLLTETKLSDLSNPDNAVDLTKQSSSLEDITQEMTEKTKKQFEKKLAGYHFSLKDVEGLSRIGLMYLLQSQYISAKDGKYNVDTQLNEVAEKEKKLENIGFESYQTMLNNREEMSHKPADSNEWVAQLPTFTKAKQAHRHLLNAYMDGNILSYIKSKEYVQNNGEIFIGRDQQRNKQWLQTMITELDSRKQTFVAVDVTYLPGEEGLIRLLEEEGYVVEKVTIK